jgi:hypothetical protein
MAKATGSRKVKLAGGRVVTLTAEQIRALRVINKAGAFHSHNGVSRTTVAILEDLGLVTVEWKTVMVETAHGYRGVWRQRPQLDWTARINRAALGR